MENPIGDINSLRSFSRCQSSTPLGSSRRQLSCGSFHSGNPLGVVNGQFPLVVLLLSNVDCSLMGTPQGLQTVGDTLERLSMLTPCGSFMVVIRRRPPQGLLSMSIVDSLWEFTCCRMSTPFGSFLVIIRWGPPWLLRMSIIDFFWELACRIPQRGC